MAYAVSHHQPTAMKHQIENDETICWGPAEFLPRLRQLGFIGTGSVTPA